MEVKEKSDRICQNIISSNLFQQAERILAYAPLGNEVDIRPVIEEGWRQQKRIVFPLHRYCVVFANPFPPLFQAGGQQGQPCHHQLEE